MVISPWVEVLGLTAEDRQRSYLAQVLELGADAMLANGLTLGAWVAMVASEADALAGLVDQTGEGEGTIVTLAALYEAGGWTVDAAVRFTRTEYSQVLDGTAGEAEAEGVVFRASVSRAFDMGNGGTLSPTAVLITGTEDVTGTGGGLAGSGTREVSFTEASIGAVYAHDLGGGTAPLGLFADSLDVGGDAGALLIGVDREGTSGRIELGFEAALSDTVDLSTGVSYGGLGTDMEVVQGALGLAITF